MKEKEEQSVAKSLKSILSSILLILVLILILPIILAIFVILFIPWYIRKWVLLLRVKQEFYPKGKYILFIYSSNPLWEEYAENNIIPNIASKAYILNWSEKFKWINQNKLEVKLYKHFMWGREWIWKQNVRMGGQEYNHMAIVFYPWWKPKKFSFWPAFKDYEFGKEEKLKQVEKDFFNYIENLENVIGKQHE